MKKDTMDFIQNHFKVLTKADTHGLSDLVPMKLWPSQKYYIENRTHRDIILKSRQTGISTAVMAANAEMLFTHPYQRMIIITHDQETSEFLFQTVQRFYRNLPPEWRPETDWKSGTRMRFNVIDSYIYIDSAKSDSLGIGHTLNVAHLSEMARWPPRKAAQLFSDISQTVPAGGFITAEGTPRGRAGIFYQLYNAAQRGEINYKPFFFPWWWDITAIREAKDILKYTDEEKELIAYVKRIDKIDLSPMQIAFRREKIAELGDLFYQEYAENDVDCWLSGEMSVFDGMAIKRYLQKIDKGMTAGDVTTWKDVIGGEEYVIGVDPAGGYEKGDYTVASMLRVKTNEYVARIRGRIPPDLFAEELIRMGRHYNEALIAVPRDSHGHTILRILLEVNYPKLYYRQEYDDVLGKIAGQPGWVTSGKTKPQMVDGMKIALRSNDIILWSENFLKEAAEYTVEGNVYSKPPGGFDDELDALMVALQVRNDMPIAEEKRYESISYARI